MCFRASPVAVCRVEALGGARSGVGAELGPGAGATTRGAVSEALIGGGREAFSVEGPNSGGLEVLGLLSALSSVLPVLLFTQEEEEEEEEEEPP